MAVLKHGVPPRPCKIPFFICIVFSVSAYAAPRITGLSPSPGVVGTLVTISGRGFTATQGTSTLAFNGVITVPVSWNPTKIIALVPSVATSGNVVVTVEDVASSGATFTVIPNVTNLSANPGAVGALVTQRRHPSCTTCGYCDCLSRDRIHCDERLCKTRETKIFGEHEYDNDDRGEGR